MYLTWKTINIDFNVLDIKTINIYFYVLDMKNHQILVSMYVLDKKKKKTLNIGFYVLEMKIFKSENKKK